MSEQTDSHDAASRFDPVCVVHGKRFSEHVCLYCCLCFRDLTPDECHVTEDGSREDVCNKCAAAEEAWWRGEQARTARYV